MRKKAAYNEFSETDKFLDDLFRENCEFDWVVAAPQTSVDTAQNIISVNPEGQAEENYLKELVADIGEKLTEIINYAKTLPDKKGRNSFFTKEELISRVISINTMVDEIIINIEDEAQAMGKPTIVGGEMPVTATMF